MTSLPTTVNRTAALAAFERKPCTVLELTLDKCANVFGTLPCTASGAIGTECYNTYGTCQAQASYLKTTQVVQFVSRGVQSPLGMSLRPYLLAANFSPTQLNIEAGLATRNSITVQLADEPDNDADQDPYYATRPAKATGTFMTRLLARNQYYFGRTATLRRGFVVSPWDWTLFLNETYQIDTVTWPDANGILQFTLKDALKFADLAKIPAPTSGALQADLKALENTGQVVAATSNTITLQSAASAVDNYYVGMEVYITNSTGAGQRRVISAYAGASYTATLATVFSVIPDTTSTYQIGALSINVGTSVGVQYSDTGTSGKNEYLRVGSEIIRYSAKSGDVLSWADTTYRAAWGSTIADHKMGDAVQLCRAYEDQPVSTVLLSMLAESGVPSALIDTVTFVSEDALWYGSAYHIDACLSAPDSVPTYLGEILTQINACIWADPQTSLIEFKGLMPSQSAPPLWDENQTIISGSLTITSQDTLRITQAAINYALYDATANLTEPKNYLRAEMAINANAMSVNEYGDSRPDLVYSRWFEIGKNNAVHASAVRKMNRLADAPKDITLSIDPKDYTVPVGQAANIRSRRLVDITGAAMTTQCIVTSITDRGAQIDVSLRTTNFDSRAGFIATAADPDYPTDTVYAHIALSTGLMADGSAGYTII